MSLGSFGYFCVFLKVDLHSCNLLGPRIRTCRVSNLCNLFIVSLCKHVNRFSFFGAGAPGRFMMAFDCTYLTTTLSQLQLHSQRGMVGGMWFPDQMENSFLSLDNPIDMKKVLKASTMLEVMVWDPSLRRKLPIPIASLPVQHNFSGSGASHRGCYYMLRTIGKIMAQNNGTVKGLLFDAHGSHMYVRRCLHGQFDGLCREDFADIEFFGDLVYEPVPEHGLPRFPISIAKYKNEVVWGLCGICPSSGVCAANFPFGSTQHNFCIYVVLC